ncbi:hypothetical protein [Sodalis endosymbiont of Henestaris halophilus]|uniref:hypothetical protein n=1 Tax=Sodalis endosymbiont of Henestaris halophilus TaxID=1929246 RepID=UPI0012FDA1B9|nr:hypothetical protein [Sodalis endosymbiont of Henestaris halophilus]
MARKCAAATDSLAGNKCIDMEIFTLSCQAQNAKKDLECPLLPNLHRITSYVGYYSVHRDKIMIGKLQYLLHSRSHFCR